MFRKSFALYCLMLFNFGVSNCLSQELFFEKISVREAGPVTQIHGIAKDSIGYIWFGSWNGAYRYDGKTFDFFYHDPKDKNSLPNNRIRNIVSDKKLGLWFLTFDRRYARFNYQLNSFKVIPNPKVPKSIAEKLSTKSNELNKNRIVNGKRYFLSSHLFTSLDIKKEKKYSYTASINRPGQLLDDFITDFFIDDENIIWLGTRGGSVYKANPNRDPFELHYTYRKDIESRQLATVKAILKADDKIWLGTDEGILIYNKEGLDYDHPFYKSNTQIKNVRSFFKDNKERIWIAGRSGLECYDPKSNKTKAVINRALYPNLEIMSVYALEASGNNLWIGLYNGIACVNLTNDTIRFYDLAADVNNGSVMDILSVNSRELWLGTEGNGVIRLRLNNKGQLYDKLSLSAFDRHLENRITGNIIYALHRDKRGAIWVGSSEGLNKINTNSNPMRIEKVQLQSEGPNIYISSITDDSKGNLWIAHKQGISMIDIETSKISNYRKEDQFGSWTFTERAFYKDPAGLKIYFGDQNGYLSFSPNEIKTTSVNNDKMIFKTLYLSNEKVIPMNTINDQIVLTKDLSQTQLIELDYENRSFTIELASFNYGNTNKIAYEYILEGYEDQWTKTNSSKITYKKLPPGDYVLKVRVVSPNDIKSAIRVLEIDVNAPWYGTWWSKMFFLSLLAAIFFWIFKAMLYRDRLRNEIKMERLNVERQESLNKEKIEFFTNISHDLKTPLSLIEDPLKRIQDDKVAPEDKEIYFSIVNRNLNYLTRLIHQILDFRKSETGKLKLDPTDQNFNHFIEECYTSFQFIAVKRNITLRIQIDKTPLYCSLDFDKAQQIIMNIVSNAFQYTSDGGLVMLSAGLNREKDALEILIEDNGVGINAAELEKIFEPFNNVGPSPYHGYSSGIGLSLTRNLIELLKGTITIESTPDKGTKVMICLPYIAATVEDSIPVKLEQKYQNKDYQDNKEIEEEKEQNSFESFTPTLLIVEDNLDVQTYLNKELGKEYTLIQEYDGKKGLEAAIKYIPDIIVSDIMMPEMQGTEFCKKLKRNENTSHIPLIFLTAKDTDENQILGYNLGAEAYVMKPFNVDVLNAQIKSVLENRIILQKRRAGIKKIDQLQQEVTDVDNDFLKRILEIITLNIEETDFSAEELSRALGISERQLYRKMKGVSGNSVREFVTKVRMNKAEELLKNSNFSISQIGYKVGYSEPSNFSRTFSKHFGCSPSQYLK
jgi:signal transduction histidine kinase/ligand-binding sensor domain-containing protein/DNA-binding response OmpR family regulator